MSEYYNHVFIYDYADSGSGPGMTQFMVQNDNYAKYAIWRLSAPREQSPGEIDITSHKVDFTTLVL